MTASPHTLLALGAPACGGRCTGGAPHRNADGSAPTLVELEKRFAAIITAFDRCIAEVEGNLPWYEYLGGPLVVAADKYLRNEETRQTRNDRKNLLAKWAASKTDAERIEIVKLAERWYDANRFGLNNCKGIVPTMGEAMVDQAKDYGHAVKQAAVDAKDALVDKLGKPLLYVGVGLGTILLVGHLVRSR